MPEGLQLATPLIENEEERVQGGADHLQDPLAEVGLTAGVQGLGGMQDAQGTGNLFSGGMMNLGAMEEKSTADEGQLYLGAINQAQDSLSAEASTSDGYTENERATKARRHDNRKNRETEYANIFGEKALDRRGGVMGMGSIYRGAAKNIMNGRAKEQAYAENPELAKKAGLFDFGKKKKKKNAKRDAFNEMYGQKRDANQVRKDGNKDLKGRLKEESQGMGGDESSQKAWAYNQYVNQRTYVDGEAGKKKGVAHGKKKGAKRIRKAQNQDLKANYNQQVDEGKFSQKKADKLYLRNKQGSNDSQGAVDAENERRRKIENYKLKKQLGTGGDYYQSRKTLSAEGQKEKDKKQDKTLRKQNVGRRNESLREEFSDGDGNLDKLAYYARAEASSDKKRKKRNGKLKKQLRKQGGSDWDAEYRGLKIGREDYQDSKGTASAAIGVANTLGGGLAVGAKSGISQVFKATDAINGESAASTEWAGDFGGAGEMAAVTKTATNALGTVDSFIKLGNALNDRGSSDSAVRVNAERQVANHAISAFGGLMSTAQQGVNIGAQFADLGAGTLGGDMVPGLGIVTSLVQVVQATKRIAESSVRLGKIGKIRDTAKSSGELDVNHALRGLKNADLQMLTNASVDVALAGTATAANIMRVIPVANVAGEALAGVVTQIRMIKGQANRVIEHFKGMKLNKSDKKVRELKAKAKNNTLSAEDNARMVKHGKALIGEDLNVGTQIIVQRAREGSPAALKYLKLFGLHEQDLESSSDSAIRKLVLDSIEADADPQTLMYQMRDIYRGAKSGVNGLIKNKRKY